MPTPTDPRIKELSRRLENRLSYDGVTWTMQAIVVFGRHDLPRDAREMSFAAQDYERLTNTADRTVEGIIDAMLHSPRKAEWPS